MPPTFGQAVMMSIAVSSSRDYRRCGRVLVCGVLLSSVVLAGCASNPPAPQPRARAASPPARAQPRARAASPPARAEANRGNPPFYDVFGKRYQVLGSSDGYRERGIASWYGRDFHGRPTSSGEKYDMHAMTAAHKTLPLPTWVEVTNLSNGKRVILKVNDRGPFVGTRLIDLSYAAAKALDVVQAGTARVEVRALGPRPPETTTTAESRRNRREPSTSADERVAAAEPVRPPPAVPPPAVPSLAVPPPAVPGERLFVQTGKFKARDSAVQFVDRLKANGFVNAFVVSDWGRRKSSHSVRVGPLADTAEFNRVSDRLRELGAKRSQRVVM